MKRLILTLAIVSMVTLTCFWLSTSPQGENRSTQRATAQEPLQEQEVKKIILDTPEESKKESLKIKGALVKKDSDYYESRYKVLNDYAEAENIVDHLNKDDISSSQREYYEKILERLSWYKLKAIEVRITQLEKEIGS